MIDFSTLQGLTIPEGVVTQIADAAGNVIWALSNEPIVLEVAKITSDTYASETTYEDENFILLDIYPRSSSSTVNISYGNLTKTLSFSGTNAQQVYFGTFQGVSDEVETPASGTLTIEGGWKGIAVGSYSNSDKSTTYCGCVTAITDFGDMKNIGDYAFSQCTGMTSVVIPNSVTTIGDYAFNGCNGLTSVTIPNSVTTIGEYAFHIAANCTFIVNGLPMMSTTSMSLDSSYTRTIKCYFYDDMWDWDKWAITPTPYSHTDETDTTGSTHKQTTLVYINDIKVEDITSVELKNCSNICVYSFYNFVSLTGITIPNSVTTIGYGAFQSCTGLTSITIPNSVTAIGYGAFWYCNSLTSVMFDNTSGWYVTKTAGGDASTGITVDVSDAANNVTLLTDTYSDYYWYRS